MNSSLTKPDFAQVLAGVLTRHNDPVEEASDSSSDCEIDEIDDKRESVNDHEYQNRLNISLENQYANGETIVKSRRDHRADKLPAKGVSCRVNKPPRAVPRLSCPGPSLPNKQKVLKIIVDREVEENDYDDIYIGATSVPVDLKGSKPPQSSAPTDKNRPGAPTSSVPELRRQNSDLDSRPLNRVHKDTMTGIQDQKKLLKVKPPPPTPQPKKSPDLPATGKSPSLVINNNDEIEVRKVLRRSKVYSPSADDVREWPEGNKKEMRGFMDCSRLDRSTKVAQ